MIWLNLLAENEPIQNYTEKYIYFVKFSAHSF
jgi:hypothetical protein